MSKKVVAVRPYIYKNNSNFKLPLYDEWIKCGGKGIGKRCLERCYMSLSYHLDLPTLWQSEYEARLRFVEGAGVRFETFPDYMTHEVIPVIWDCWPCYWPTMEAWFKRHQVKTAFFTSSETANHFRVVFPNSNIYHLPEAIETKLYKTGQSLKERDIDFLKFGRVCNTVDTSLLDKSLKVIESRNENGVLHTRQDLIKALADSKVTIAMPRCDNQPEIAQGIETLTQRFWECMLSRVVILGRAPKELIDIIGYDPCVNIWDTTRVGEGKFASDGMARQIEYIIAHIEDYQALVDKNRDTALRLGDWTLRIKQVMEWLEECGYEV